MATRSDPERPADARTVATATRPASTSDSPSTMGCRFAVTGDEWEKVTGLHQQGRGGFLGMAVFLTKNSQPQRTSPVKRGFWVVHKLLGEHIPAAAARCRGPAGQGDRHQRQDAFASCWRCTPENATLCPLPSALRPRRPVDGRLRRHRPEPQPRTWRAGPSTIACTLPSGEAGARHSRVLEIPGRRAEARVHPDAVPQVPRLRPGPLARAFGPGLLEKMQAELEKNDYRFSMPVRNRGDEPAIPQSTRQGLTRPLFRNRSTRRETVNSPNQISRRMLLQGLGCTVALPWLESAKLFADERRAAQAKPPQRFACLFRATASRRTTGGRRATARRWSWARAWSRWRPTRKSSTSSTACSIGTATAATPGAPATSFPAPTLQRGRMISGGVSMDQKLAQHFEEETAGAQPGARLRAAGERLPREPVLDGLCLAHFVAHAEFADPDRTVSRRWPSTASSAARPASCKGASSTTCCRRPTTCAAR